MKKYAAPFLIVIAILSFFALSKGDDIFFFIKKAKATSVEQLDPETLIRRMATDDNLFLLDVRQPEEYETGHIKGSKLIPLGELASRISELPKDKTIVVYCRSGRRSGQAAEILQHEGFEKVINLSGGMIQWTRTRACDAQSKEC